MTTVRAHRLRPTASRGVPTVYVDGEIAQDLGTAKHFREQLLAVGDVPELRVEINTDGGQVSEGMAMYHALRAHPARKIGVVLGIAASMGSVLLMACDERRVAQGAMVMVHQAKGGARGTADDIAAQAEVVRKLEGDLIAIYEARTKLTREQLVEVMSVDRYMTAAEAIEWGFADAVETYPARVPYDVAARLVRSSDTRAKKVVEALASRGMVLSGDAQARAAVYLARAKKGSI